MTTPSQADLNRCGAAIETHARYWASKGDVQGADSLRTSWRRVRSLCEAYFSEGFLK